MPSPQEVVENFCDAVGRKDVATVESLFADDIVYHNVGWAPAVGISAAMAAIHHMFDNLGDVEFRLVHIAANDNVVLTERIDVVTPGGVYAPLPVSGTFVVEDGKIRRWRDYFDSALNAKIMRGEDTSDVGFTYE